MMDVTPAHADVVKRSDVVVDGDGDAANDYGSSKEADRSEKKPFAATLGKLLLVDCPQAGPGDDERQQPQNSRDDERPDPKAWVRPRHSNVTLTHACDLTNSVNQAFSRVNLGLRCDRQAALVDCIGCDGANCGDFGTAHALDADEPNQVNYGRRTRE